ncbi:MAG TPA: HepT-like ribonuclease domain-containing protein [Bacteriovoracaceae bacterium]|nr:HepT-like ribonuclease domain-containing protein [Bacteriovoracaceae bacterium]
MSKLHDDSYLLDILDSAEQIKLFTENLSINEFEQDLKSNLAVQRLFEIIGEATKNLSSDLRDKNPQIDWKAMAGMRDILIHQYHNASSERIFKVARNNIPDLILKIKKLIQK